MCVCVIRSVPCSVLHLSRCLLLLLLQTYVDYMSRLYEREIKDFFEVAKIKMAGTSKEAKGKFGKHLVELLSGIRISLCLNICSCLVLPV